MSTGKIISAPAAALALLCFFLPWLSVSCDAAVFGETELVDFTGYELASKGPLAVISDGMEEGLSNLGELMGEDLLGEFASSDLAEEDLTAELSDLESGDSLLYVIPLAGAIALILVLAAYQSWVSDQASATGILLLALAGLGVLLLRWWTIRTALVSIPDPVIVLNFEYGLWGTILGLGAMLIGAIVSLNESQDVAEAFDYTLGQPTSANVGEMEIYPPLSPDDLETRDQSDPGPTEFVAGPGSSFDDFGGSTPAKTEVLSREPEALAWLVVREGARAGQQFRVSELTSIGRDPTNDIVLDDTALSGSHARVRLEDDVFYIYDLASTNGVEMYRPATSTWEQIYRHELQDGDNIKIGRTVLHFMALADLESGEADA